MVVVQESKNRISAMATLGDVFDSLGSMLPPFLKVVFPLILTGNVYCACFSFAFVESEFLRCCAVVVLVVV